MLTSNFSYSLPEELIAQFPLPERTASRLLHLNAETNTITHSHFIDICNYLRTNDLLILNDSKVIPARLFGRKGSGGKVEIMLERILNEQEALVQIRASKAPKVNTKIIIADNHHTQNNLGTSICHPHERVDPEQTKRTNYFMHDPNIILEIIARINDLFRVRFINTYDIFTMFQQIGQVPLPPYIERKSRELDKDRYQTVYARHSGSVAAPTAGLHLNNELLQKINNFGVEFGYVTLHVGAGTFQPIRTAIIDEHHIHHELINVSAELCAKIIETKRRGGRIIAVGTTTLRALETAASTGSLQAFFGDTDIFIKPGFQFKIVDALITNFHLPMSTLLILTCTFGGFEQVLHAYQDAIKHKYRFYSYGDCMFIQ